MSLDTTCTACYAIQPAFVDHLPATLAHRFGDLRPGSTPPVTGIAQGWDGGGSGHWEGKIGSVRGSCVAQCGWLSGVTLHRRRYGTRLLPVPEAGRSSFPDKMYPNFLLWLYPLSPPFFEYLTNVLQKDEQCIRHVPCALRLHCSLIEYIFRYNALHCFASQHETKVSYNCASQMQTRLLPTAELFFFNVF